MDAPMDARLQVSGKHAGAKASEFFNARFKTENGKIGGSLRAFPG